MSTPQYPVPPYSPYGYPGHAQPPNNKKTPKWPFIVGGLIAFIVLVGACGGSRTTTSSAPYYGPAGTTAAPTAAAQQAPAKPAGPLTQFGDGTYEVGVDVTPGRYKTPGSGGEGIWESCYWERAENDTGDFGSIISNENLQGPGTVTLKKGEFFKTNGGCKWTKQ